MPVTRAINGHGPTVKPVVDYLTRDGRAVAADFLNCLEVDRHGRPVWQQMDECRRAMGCDAPWPGHERARTWEHIVVSPDPADCCDLETLRDLATSWARRYLGGYQVAIYYHDDNALRIPHAHLVVNNASLDRPGGRLSTELTHERWREMFCGLQDMARERGLSGLDLLPEGSRRTGGTVQRTYRTSRDIELEARDASWKRDVRDRMACAVRLSGGEGEYVEACRALGLTVRESRGRDFGGEWVYGHPGAGREVAGPTLGRDWSRAGIGRRIARDGLAGVTKPSGPGREALLAAMAGLSSPDGTMALQVIGTTRGTPVTAGQVSGMLDVCRDFDVRSMADMDEAIAEATGDGDRRRLEAAREIALALGHLPDERDPVDGPRMMGAFDSSQSGTSWDEGLQRAGWQAQEAWPVPLRDLDTYELEEWHAH